MIEWEKDASLLSVTKKSIEFYQRLHPYNEFYNLRSLKDKRFIPEEEEEEEKEKDNNGEDQGEEEKESESSMSLESDTECDELPVTIKIEAQQAYEETRKAMLLAPAP